ncbi:MAG TPA: efflux RND transporter periplasmic adaptor subunit [bacterium (Candidatus Stahlbacteria)]|nr:efflux RND transporter periplasmic adaptor subunit [Candidatus Stahlbacteria bacterium]
MRKVIAWIIVVAIVFLIGFRIYQARQRIKVVGTEEDIATPVAVTNPKIGDITSTLSFIGNIKGEDQVMVFPPVSGKLLKYTVAEGDRVDKDGVIALIDQSMPGMEYEPAKVKSPISGVVGKLLLDRGSAVMASRMMPSQTPVAIIVKMDKVKAVFNVSERDLAKVKKGQIAEIRVDAYPEEVFKGKITRISQVIDPTSRTATCEAIVPNPKHKLKPGMFAEIDLIIETHKNVLLLPHDALIRELDKGTYYLFIVEDEKAIRKEVEVGLMSRDTVEIKSGISKEDKVVVKGQHYLEDGEKVEIIS